MPPRRPSPEVEFARRKPKGFGSPNERFSRVYNMIARGLDERGKVIEATRRAKLAQSLVNAIEQGQVNADPRVKLALETIVDMSKGDMTPDIQKLRATVRAAELERFERAKEKARPFIESAVKSTEKIQTHRIKEMTGDSHKFVGQLVEFAVKKENPLKSWTKGEVKGFFNPIKDVLTSNPFGKRGREARGKIEKFFRTPLLDSLYHSYKKLTDKGKFNSAKLYNKTLLAEMSFLDKEGIRKGFDKVRKDVAYRQFYEQNRKEGSPDFASFVNKLEREIDFIKSRINPATVSYLQDLNRYHDENLRDAYRLLGEKLSDASHKSGVAFNDLSSKGIEDFFGRLGAANPSVSEHLAEELRILSIEISRRTQAHVEKFMKQHMNKVLNKFRMAKYYRTPEELKSYDLGVRQHLEPSH